MWPCRPCCSEQHRWQAATQSTSARVGEMAGAAKAQAARSWGLPQQGGAGRARGPRGAGAWAAVLRPPRAPPVTSRSQRFLLASFPEAAGGTRGPLAWPALKHGGWERRVGCRPHLHRRPHYRNVQRKLSPDHTKGEVNIIWGKLLCFYYTNLLYFSHLCSLSHKLHVKKTTVAN